MNLQDFVSAANQRSVAASRQSAFPHMSKADTKVWTAFLQTGLITFDAILYDVGLGGKALGELPPEAADRPMWETLVKKRVDAVGLLGAQVWTIEVKPLGNMAALGQSITYRALWAQERGNNENTRPMVVCSRVDLDVEPVFLTYGVTVVVVTPSSGGEPAVIDRVIGELPSPTNSQRSNR